MTYQNQVDYAIQSASGREDASYVSAMNLGAAAAGLGVDVTKGPKRSDIPNLQKATLLTSGVVAKNLFGDAINMPGADDGKHDMLARRFMKAYGVDVRQFETAIAENPYVAPQFNGFVSNSMEQDFNAEQQTWLRQFQDKELYAMAQGIDASIPDTAGRDAWRNVVTTDIAQKVQSALAKKRSGLEGIVN